MLKKQKSRREHLASAASCVINFTALNHQSHKPFLYDFVSENRESSYADRAHHQPLWKVARTVTLSKAGVSFAFGVGVWCGNKPNQRCVSAPSITLPQKKYKYKKRANHSPVSSASAVSAPPPHLAVGARMHKHRRHFPSLVSLLLSSLCFSDALSLSLSTPCSWRPR